MCQANLRRECFDVVPKETISHSLVNPFFSASDGHKFEASSITLDLVGKPAGHIRGKFLVGPEAGEYFAAVKFDEGHSTDRDSIAVICVREKRCFGKSLTCPCAMNHDESACLRQAFQIDPSRFQTKQPAGPPALSKQHLAVFEIEGACCAIFKMVERKWKHPARLI